MPKFHRRDLGNQSDMRVAETGPSPARQSNLELEHLEVLNAREYANGRDGPFPQWYEPSPEGFLRRAFEHFLQLSR